jgi:hypothetical protein
VSFSFTSKLAAFCLLAAAAVPVVAVHRWWIWLDVVWLAMGGLALLLWPDRTAHRFRDGPFGPVRGRSMSILSIQQTRIDAAPADSDSFRNYKATPKDSVRAYNFFAFFGVLYALREWHAAIAVAVILGTGYLVLGRRALSQHDSVSG